MSEPLILSSENPDADVLVYDKTRKYYEGELIENGGDTLVASDNGTEVDLEFEFVSEA